MVSLEGFENYVITPQGVVTNTNTGRVLKASLNENGYLYVSLWKNNRGYTRSLHRLVAQAYVPNPDQKPFVNHIDADRSNTFADNLEWCTQSENIKHAYNIGNMSQKKHFTQEELEWLLSKFLAGETMTHLASTMAVGLSRTTINLRNHSIRTNQKELFDTELRKQKVARNTSANTGKRKPIHQLDNHNNVIASFPSATAAARSLGKATAGSISNALNPDKKQQEAFGFRWKYA